MRWGLVSRLNWCEMRDKGNVQLTSCDRIQHNRYINNIWSTRTRYDPAQYKLDSQETQLTHLPREQKCEIERKHRRCHHVQTVVLNEKTSLCSLHSSQTRLRLIGQPEVMLCALYRKHDLMFTDTYTVIWVLEQNQMLRGVQRTYRFFMLPLDLESLQKEIIRMKTSTRTQWSPFLLNMNGQAD